MKKRCRLHVEAKHSVLTGSWYPADYGALPMWQQFIEYEQGQPCWIEWRT